VVSQKTLITELTAPLQKAGITDARREIMILLSHVLDQPVAAILAQMDQLILPQIESEIRQLVSRRQNREPIAYLTGSADFAGLQFDVGPGVLVPRPDSEIIVEAAVRAILEQKVLAQAEKQAQVDTSMTSGQMESKSLSQNPIQYLDTCTGSGAIGIAVASQIHRLGMPITVHLVDISDTAIVYARRNAARLCHHIPVAIEVSDLFPKIPSLFDLITINPPYIVNAVLPTLMPEVSCHEPSLALAGGPDGIDLYRRILNRIKEYLRPNGLLFLEHGYDQAEAVADLIQAEGGFTELCLIKDYGGNPRVTSSRRSL
jgi:release factor glutamine methyltransferase